MSEWEIVEGVLLVRSLNVALGRVGYACGLTGSVLLRGSSKKDLDVIVFPLSTSKLDRNALDRCLEDFGGVRLLDRAELLKEWRKKGSRDTKHVEVWMFGGRRVDLMFLR